MMFGLVRQGINRPRKIPGFLKRQFDFRLRLISNKLPPRWTLKDFTGLDYLIVEPVSDIEQPALTGDGIDDFSAAWVADPFLQYDDRSYYLFAEAAKSGYPDNGACLVWYESDDGIDWEYQGIVLNKEPGSKVIDSYPQVIKHDNSRFLIPSFGADPGLDQFHIYEFIDFPGKVEHVESPISGPVRGDPTVFEWDGRWYCIFEDFDYCLRLYCSETLVGGNWTEHPSSPVEDERQLRPGGRPVVKSDYIDFFTQGPRSDRTSLLYHRITTLTPTAFSWEEVPASPVVYPAGCPGRWNEWKMHHMDYVQTGPKQALVAVDGQDRNHNWSIGIYRISPGSNYSL